jgi:hypothetical protein
MSTYLLYIVMSLYGRKSAGKEDPVEQCSSLLRWRRLSAVEEGEAVSWITLGRTYQKFHTFLSGSSIKDGTFYTSV